MIGNEKELVWKQYRLGVFGCKEMLLLFNTCFPEISNSELKRLAKQGAIHIWLTERDVISLQKQGVNI